MPASDHEFLNHYLACILHFGNLMASFRSQDLLETRHVHADAALLHCHGQVQQNHQNRNICSLTLAKLGG